MLKDSDYLGNYVAKDSDYLGNYVAVISLGGDHHEHSKIRRTG